MPQWLVLRGKGCFVQDPEVTCLNPIWVKLEVKLDTFTFYIDTATY